MSYGHAGPNTNSHEAVTLRPDLAAMLIDLCGTAVGCDWFITKGGYYHRPVMH